MATELETEIEMRLLEDELKEEQEALEKEKALKAKYRELRRERALAKAKEMTDGDEDEAKPEEHGPTKRPAPLADAEVPVAEAPPPPKRAAPTPERAPSPAAPKVANGHSEEVVVDRKEEEQPAAAESPKASEVMIAAQTL